MERLTKRRLQLDTVEAYACICLYGVAAMLVIAYVIYPITQRYRIETMHTITTSKELKEAST